MKQRITFFLLCVCLTVLLTACGGDKQPPTTVLTRAEGQVVNRTDAASTAAATSVTDVTKEASATAAPTAPTAPAVIAEGEGVSETGKAVAALASSLVGTPFRSGGSDPEVGFDNPSFVVYCYGKSGITVSRNASSLALYGQDVPPDELHTGDILVFADESGGSPSFVGIYIGGNQLVACCNPDRGTCTLKLTDNYWSQRFIAARRPS